MSQYMHLYFVIVLHLGFAVAIYLWRGNELFSRLFSAAWIIEAARAAIVLPDVHSIGDGRFVSEWFCVADVLNCCATALLISSGAALMRVRTPNRWTAFYLGISIPALVLVRYAAPDVIEWCYSVSPSRAQFLAVSANVVIMFVPVTIMRGVFTCWLFRSWQRTHSAGALIAVVFGVTYTTVAIAVPFQFYYTWYPSWMKFLWGARVFGFSLGILMLIMDRNERELLASNLQLLETMTLLERAQKQVIGQERLKALGQMAAGVAHDINNGLTPLLAYANLLESRNDLPLDVHELTKAIRLGAEDTANTVRRLDHFYRESHNREVLETLDLAELVEQTVELTQPKWQSQARADRQQIQVSTEINVRPRIRGEASQLRSAITNLIFNACEAIEDTGSIHLRVDSCDGDAVVTVTDSGSGMTHEQLERCLEPFYTSKPQGGGLGLSECHGIIRQHGGMMEVDSIDGQSTTVRFTIPVDPSPRPADPVDTRADDADDAGEADGVMPTILCIDDDHHVAFALASMLEFLPSRVEVAYDGESGINLLQETMFDLVVCDQGLPGMDGISVMRTIKTLRPDIPVIMASGWSLPEITDGPHPDDFIAKPFDVSSLHAIVREHLPPTKKGVA